MLLDLIRALCAAVAAVALPGYFWAVLLRPGGGLAERLGYSCALSLATVPVVALVLARLARSGITLWIAIAAVVLVLGSGALALLWRGAPHGPAGPILPAPRAIQDPRALVLLAVAFVAALRLGSAFRCAAGLAGRADPPAAGAGRRRGPGHGGPPGPGSGGPAGGRGPGGPAGSQGPGGPAGGGRERREAPPGRARESRRRHRLSAGRCWPSCSGRRRSAPTSR